METHILNTQTGKVRAMEPGEEPGANEMAIPGWVARHPTRARMLYYQGSRQAAIGAFCVMCMGGDVPSVTRLVRECASTWCPLWVHRPLGYNPETKDPFEKPEVPDHVPSKDLLRKMVKARSLKAKSDDQGEEPGQITRVRL